MNRAPAASLQTLARHAREAGILFERCGALAGVALAALDKDGGSTLVGALEERDRVLEQLAPLVAKLEVARTGMKAKGRMAPEVHHLQTIIQPVEEAARHAFSLQARLAARLEERRRAIRTELDQLSTADRAASAYAPRPVVEVRRIDRAS